MMQAAAAALAYVLVAGLLATAQVTVPLYKNEGDGFDDDGFGVYVVASLGGQDVGLILDTGSSTLAVPTPTTTCSGSASSPFPCPLPVCSSTSQCTSGVYNPDSSPTKDYYSSSSYAPSYCNTAVTIGGQQRCGFAVSYGIGKTSGIQGYLVWDDLSLGNYAGQVNFGVMTEVPPNWQRPPAAGIFGVSYDRSNCLPGTIGSTSGYTCPRQPLSLWLSSNGLADQFSMCMGNPNQNGKITFGGVDQSLYTGVFSYTPIILDTQQGTVEQSNYWYTITMTDVGVGGSHLNVATNVFALDYGGTLRGGTIVDSGTPRLYLVEPAYDAYTQSQTSCSQDSDCDITLFLDGATLQVPGLATCSSGTCALGDYVASAKTRTIIGYAVMRNYYVHFDRENPAQVGFATPTSACKP